MSKSLLATIKPRSIDDLDDYWHFYEGELGYTWADKPHRIVYDLIAAVLFEHDRAERYWDNFVIEAKARAADSGALGYCKGVIDYQQKYINTILANHPEIEKEMQDQ